MNLRLLAKDQNSGRNGCPSVFIDLDSAGTAVVWSNKLPWLSARRIPNRLRGERGTRIKMDALCAAVDEYRAGKA